MPPQKTIKKAKSKNEPDFALFIKFSIVTVFIAYFASAAVTTGVKMFFGPYAAYVNENQKNNYGYIEYTTDKTEYVLGEKIKLSLVNNLKESIYLAPCWYSKTFENKRLLVNLGDNKEIGWQPIGLASNPDCNNYGINAEDESFSQIKKIADEYVSTEGLGAGIFRGVSTVYLRCIKPDATSCERGVNVYSNEFKIKDKIEK